MGASAGGLEALEDFFQHMPTDSGVAFVLVPHLDPTHKTLLTGLLQRSTQMKVCDITDRTKVRRNCIYVIPPNKDLSIEDGVLRLKPVPSPRGLRMPIDFFFRRLAEDQESRAIGVILSGMGSDGTLGLKAIKDRLGLAMAQEPASSKYESMPRNAIETGLVDFVAPPAELAARLVRYVKHSASTPRESFPLADKSMTGLQQIFALLREQTGHDFSFYKKNTIYRRIERRMTVHNQQHIQKYVHYLKDNPEETRLLFKELLIGVTNFFRDSDAWERLKEKAVPQLLKNRTRGSTLRVWVPGCSTGEEVYTVAIVLREALEKLKSRGGFKFQIFATDIDAAAIDVARHGFFAENIAGDVSPERLQQFFIKEEHGYRIKKEIREMIIFAPQNIIMDPPFTKLDLLCCRNLLIYFTPELQKKLLPLFHYALNPGGVLMLGSSETIGAFVDRFQPVDNPWKIFARKESAAALMTMVELPSSLLSRERGRPRH
jgi:two-component system CheB/CheR fusion protein